MEGPSRCTCTAEVKSGDLCTDGLVGFLPTNYNWVPWGKLRKLSKPHSFICREGIIIVSVPHELQELNKMVHLESLEPGLAPHWHSKHITTIIFYGKKP